MLRGYASLPLKRIALWGFVLNMLWEFGQCTLLYDMWDWGFWRATVWMWGAILGDVLIVLGVALGAVLLVGARRVALLGVAGWAALLGVGFVASVGLEWAAHALDLWDYSDLMPTVTVFGHTVGLSPVVQVTTLPAVAVRLAQRDTRTAGRSDTRGGDILEGPRSCVAEGAVVENGRARCSIGGCTESRF